ncbi:elongation factor P 5-aminopentanone reductase [Clostridium sp. 'White wine YQ']|uniref:elongation factor P 5-aminopentanone reductase n=1 Tax=Clostridium sp. 'White wine YQ' TaxID=3027474 RepID=UPI0023651020|nr:SDR family oxidoreductase [Clostridium sp. 'White wine YQ']MDD7794034.1 SDR family oxidoreductase [Clostridium sp. 'White wine YQ']
MSNLKGKVAIVTGASKGIGKSIAISLAEKGANIIINYNSDEKGAIDTQEKIKALGGDSYIVKGNVANYNDCQYIVDKTLNVFKRIDILVNNAGISKIGLFMDTKVEEMDSLIDVNIKGVFNMSHVVIPHMLSERRGSIINISSMWGIAGASCEVIYSSTKGAINLFTKSLAKEMGSANIRVNAVAPGVIETEMNKWMNKEEREELEEEIPLGRFGEGKEVGDLVSYLSSDESRYITGQIISIDGGFL